MRNSLIRQLPCSNKRNNSRDSNFKYNALINENNDLKNKLKKCYNKINNSYAKNKIINKENQMKKFKEDINYRRKIENQRFNTITYN